MAFDPIADIGWAHAYWAEGTEFLAESYADTDAIDSDWPDEIGTDNLLQATGTKQPAYTATGGPNSKPAVVGDGTSNQLDVTFGAALADPWSVVVIGKIPSAAMTGGTQGGFYKNASNWRMQITGSDATSSGASDSSFHLFVGCINGASSFMEVDDISEWTGSGGTDDLAVFSAFITASTYGTGPIAFVGIYDGDVTSEANWTRFTTWVQQHYGITVPNATVVPDTIAATIAVPAVTVTAGADRTPATIVATAALPAVTVTGTTEQTPAAIVATAAVPSVTVTADATVTPGAIATSATLPAPTVTAGADRTPDAIAATVALPAPTIEAGGDSTLAPDAIVTTVTVPAVTITADSTVTPDTIVTTVALGQVDTVESTPLTIVTTVTLPQVTVLADSTVTPAAIAITATVPAVTVTAGADRSPDTIVATVTVPAVTVTADATVTPGTIVCTVALPAATADTATTVSPDAIVTTVTIPAVTVNADATVTPDAISLTVTVPTVTIELTSSGSGSPATIAATVSIPQATVEITYTWTFSPPTTDDTARYRLEDGAPIRGLFRHVAGHAQGITVMKLNGAYVESTSPYQDDLLAAERVYYGGHVNPISEEEAADLTAAGYGAYLVSS